MRHHSRFSPWLTSLCLAVGLLAGGPALAAAPFQLDGNAVTADGSGYPGDDWDKVNVLGGHSALAETGLIIDDPEPIQAQFTGGGSKDQQDIPNWKWRTGSPPDKDDLSHAYAAAYLDDNQHFILTFGMDRFDTSGDAQLGFWFLKDQVKPLGTGNSGTFNGQHMNGDILVLVNFSNGGTVPTIEVYEWMGGGLLLKGAAEAVLCTGGYIPAGKNFCGITNANPVAAPWSYVNKDVGPSATFPPGAFFEGGIDVTALLPDESTCFTSFLAESRSSTSITATLKDFAGSSFNVCGFTVAKACTGGSFDDQSDANASNDTVTYDISGTVTNTGLGILYNISLTDMPDALDGDFVWDDCADPANLLDSTNGMLDMLGANQTACYRNTLTLLVSEGGYGASDQIEALANTSADGTGAVVHADEPAQATCPKFSIDSELLLTKDCKSKIATDGSKVYVQVDVTGSVCNNKTTRVYNVQLTDTREGADHDVFLAPLSLAPAGQNGDCATFSTTYTPTQALIFDGSASSNVASEIFFRDILSVKTAEDILGDDISANAIPVEAKCPLCCSGEQCQN